MYISFIRPLLEYSDVTWDNCSNDLKSDIESVQNEAARIITGATKYCNINRLLSELNWISMAERRRQHRLILFYKMKNSITPSYLSDLIPTQNNPAYLLCSANDVPTLHTRTQSYGSSFLPFTIREWNALPLGVRNAPTLPAFKTLLQHRTVPWSANLYTHGSRRMHIYHTPSTWLQHIAV